MLLFGRDSETAGFENMISAAKKEYVKKRHTRSISQMTNATGYKKNKWKTYIGPERKEIIKKTEDEIYEALFNYYVALDNRTKTFEDVFNLLVDYKRDCLGRNPNTISEDIRYFGFISDEIKQKLISDVTDEDIRKWLIKYYLPKNPKETAFKKLVQLLGQVFEFGIKRKLCYDNPVKYISIGDYLRQCDCTQKSNEQKEFCKEELLLIKQDVLQEINRPRAIMTLLAIETGMRAGELAALHKSDIGDDYIHVHRQQIRGKSEISGKEFFFEVPYTKDERLHPHDGRYIPITQECRVVLDYANKIEGESEYLFHERNSSSMISKDSYEYNLRRRCKRLGTLPKNNHAFRIAFNSRLIELGFSASDRALILGHEVQTNETHYSLTDKRRLDMIKDRLICKEEP